MARTTIPDDERYEQLPRNKPKPKPPRRNRPGRGRTDDDIGPGRDKPKKRKPGDRRGDYEGRRREQQRQAARRAAQRRRQLEERAQRQAEAENRRRQMEHLRFLARQRAIAMGRAIQQRQNQLAADAERRRQAAIQAAGTKRAFEALQRESRARFSALELDAFARQQARARTRTRELPIPTGQNRFTTPIGGRKVGSYLEDGKRGVGRNANRPRNQPSGTQIGTGWDPIGRTESAIEKVRQQLRNEQARKARELQALANRDPQQFVRRYREEPVYNSEAQREREATRRLVGKGPDARNSLLRELIQQQNDTGGRYMNRRVYAAVIADLNRERRELRLKLRYWDARATELLVTGHTPQFRRVLEDKIVPLQAEYVRFVGDGRHKRGTAEKTFDLLQQIADTDESWRQRYLTGKDLSDDEMVFKAEQEKVRKSMEYKVWVPGTGGRGGATDRYGEEMGHWVTKVRTPEEMMRIYRDEERRRGLVNKSIFNVGATQVKALEAFGDFRRTYVEDARRALEGAGYDSQEYFGKMEGEGEIQRSALFAEMMRLAQQQYDREHPSESQSVAPMTADEARVLQDTGVLPERFRGVAERSSKDWNDRDEYLDRLHGAFSAVRAGYGDRRIQELMQFPGIGEVLKGLSFSGGAVLGGLRLWLMQNVGRVYTPNVNFNTWWDGSGVPLITGGKDDLGKEHGWFEVDNSEQARMEEQKAFEEFQLSMEQGYGLEGTLNFGEKFVAGNTGQFLGSIIFDPLTYFNLGKMLTAFRAGARAGVGGMSVRLALKEVKRVWGFKPGGLRDLFTAGLFRGAPRGELTGERLLKDYNKITGKSYTHISQMTLEDHHFMEQLLLHKGDNAASMRIIKDWFGSKPIDTDQIMNTVARHAEDIANLQGVNVVNAKTFRRRLDRIERDAARMERREAAAQARRVTRDSLEQDARAAASLRRERARKGEAPVTRVVPPRSRAASRAIKRLERIQAAHLAAQRVAIDRAKAAKDQLLAARDSATRERLHKEMSEALLQHDLAGRRYAETSRRLNVQYGATGTADTARHFDVDAFRVASDQRYVVDEIDRARAALRAGTLTPGQRRYWTNRIRALGRAGRYLEQERVALGARDLMVKKVMHKYGRRAREAISAERLATRASDAAGLRGELHRGIHARAHSGVHDPTADLAMSPGRAQRLRRMLVRVSRAPIDWSDVRLSHLQATFAGMDFMEVASALWLAKQGRGARRLEYFAAWSAIEQQLRRSLPSALRGVDIEGLMVAWSRMHHLHRGMTLREFVDLDGVVMAGQRALHGGFIPESTRVNTARRTTRKPKARQLELGGELEGIVSRHHAAKSKGRTLFEYDEAKAVLGEHVDRYISNEELMNDAKKAAGILGRPFEEVWAEMRELAADEAGRRLLMNFSDAMADGKLTADEIFEAFNDVYLTRDLVNQGARGLSEYQQKLLREAFTEMTGVAWGDTDAIAKVLKPLDMPDFKNRKAVREWLVSSGRWAPRTAKVIGEGGRVWSVHEEREFFMSQFGRAPEWTDPVVLREILDDPYKYAEQLRLWGFFDDGFESQSTALFVGVDESRQAIVWGAGGVKSARSYKEMREWFAARYGDLVSPDGGKTFTSAPWVMDLVKDGGKEYTDWIHRYTAGGGILSKGLVTEVQLADFAEAVRKATARRIERLTKLGKMPNETWLPNEMTQFMLEVTDYLRAYPSWRKMWRAGRFTNEHVGLGKRIVYQAGYIMRLLVMSAPFFPVLNLLDAFGPKRFLLAIGNGGGKFFKHIDDDVMAAAPSVEAFGAARHGPFAMGTMSATGKVRNADLRMRDRLAAILRIPAEIGSEASGWGEDRIKLQFGRGVMQDYVDDLVAQGVDRQVALRLGRMEATKVVNKFFPNLDNAGPIEKFVNQLVPFFSYNTRNKMLGIRIAVTHPWLITLADKIGRVIEEENRRSWEAMGNDPAEFPVSSARQLWVSFDGGKSIIGIDLSTFSDYFRGPASVYKLLEGGADPLKQLWNIVRIPHPMQLIAASMIMGFKDWQGIPATKESLFWLFDLLSGMNPKEQPLAGDSFVDLVGRLVFAGGVREIDYTSGKRLVFFTLLKEDKEAAFEYLNKNPDLKLDFALGDESEALDYWQKLAKYGDEPKIPSWYQFPGRVQEDIEQLRKDQAAYDALKDMWEKRAEEFLGHRWGEDWAAFKEQRNLSLKGFMNEHPAILDSMQSFWNGERWEEQVGDWVTDDKIDWFFKWQDENSPKRDAFGKGTKGELEYQIALRDYQAARLAYLEANPDVVKRLAMSAYADERAWKEQQTFIDSIRRDQTKIQIRILREELKGEDKKDWEKLSFLYDLKDATYSELDAAGYVAVAPPDIMRRRISPTDLTGLQQQADAAEQQLGLPDVVKLPGQGEFWYSEADEKERKKIRQREHQAVVSERYADEIHKLFERSENNPGGWYSGLQKNDWLRRQYFKRNPGEEAKYHTTIRYISEIRALYNRSDSAAEWFAGLEANPWLRAQYYARNPEKLAQHQASSRYFNAITSLYDRVQRLPKSERGAAWFRLLDANPWLKAEYYRRNPDAKTGSSGSRYFNEITSLYRRVQRLPKSERGAAWVNGLDANPWLKAQYYARNPDAARGHGNNRYYTKITALFDWASKQDNPAAAWYQGLQKDRWLMQQYFARNPGKRASYAASKEYLSYMSRWVHLLQADKMEEAGDFFDSMPAWVKQRYFEGHPDSKMRAGAHGSSKYFAWISKWARLLEEEKFEEAKDWWEKGSDVFKEQYYAKHPDQRARMSLDTKVLAKLAIYFMMPENDPARQTYLRQNPDIAEWLEKYGGDEAARRGAIQAAYRNITDPWLKRVFRLRYPEFFDPIQLGLRRIERVEEWLKEHPELRASYEENLAEQTNNYTQQLKLEGAAPAPIKFEHVRRWRIRARRRRVRMSRHMRNELRLA